MLWCCSFEKKKKRDQHRPRPEWESQSFQRNNRRKSYSSKFSQNIVRFHWYASKENTFSKQFFPHFFYSYFMLKLNEIVLNKKWCKYISLNASNTEFFRTLNTNMGGFCSSLNHPPINLQKMEQHWYHIQFTSTPHSTLRQTYSSGCSFAPRQNNYQNFPTPLYTKKHFLRGTFPEIVNWH